MKNQYQLTIIFPINREDNYLENSIRNLNEQTLSSFFVHFVVSRPIKPFLVQVLKKLDIKFEYKIIVQNMDGIAFAMNTAIDQVTTEFIARWDSDDIFDKRRLEKQLDFLLDNQEVVVLGTKVIHIDSDGFEIGSHQFKFYESDKKIRFALRYRQPFMHSSVMYRANPIKMLGGYKYGLTAEDHQLWIRLARCKQNKFHNLDGITSRYRLHSFSIRNETSDFLKYAEMAGFFFTEFLLSKNPIYLIGILANHPYARYLRKYLRSLRRKS